MLVHEPWPLDGAPLVFRVHVPLLPARLQALHCSVQAALQQTPSAQKPVEHSTPDAQVPLVFFGTQLVPLQ